MNLSGPTPGQLLDKVTGVMEDYHNNRHQPRTMLKSCARQRQTAHQALMFKCYPGKGLYREQDNRLLVILL